jgi:hypothetical protein
MSQFASSHYDSHYLEHMHHPLHELKELRGKLRVSGKLIIVVPCETVARAYKAGDISHHLYSWSPMCIGNLLTEAGFSLIEAKPYMHKWPPMYRLIARLGGRSVFEIACRIYGRLARSWSQVRAVAHRSDRIEAQQQDQAKTAPIRGDGIACEPP